MRKPKGYWQDLSNVLKHIEPLIVKYGRFPSNSELVKEGLGSISRYIYKYHGGSLNLARKLGVSTYDETINRRHHHSWNSKVVIELFQDFIKEHEINYFPSQADFSKEKSDVYAGIISVFNSYSNFKNFYNHNFSILNEKKKPVKWTWQRIIEILSPLVEELGYFPSSSDLDSRGLIGLRGHISKNHLLQKLKEHFNVEGKPRRYTVSRESGYWNNIDNVKKEAISIFNDFGRLLSNKELLELGYGSLSNHLKRLPKELLENLGYFSNSNLIKTKDGHFVRSIYELLFDNFLSFNSIRHHYEQIIPGQAGTNYQFDFCLHLENDKDVFGEIWGFTRNRTEQEMAYHTKRLEKESLYNELNLNLIGINAEIFDKSFMAIYSYLEKVVKKHFREIVINPMNLNYFLWGSGYKESTIISELQKVIESNSGYFPSTDQLRNLDNGEGLISRIQKFGGVEYFKSKLGVESKPRELKWSLDLIESELIKENGGRYIPSLSEFREIGRLDIYGGIQKFGGVKLVSSKIGIPNKSQYLKQFKKPIRSIWTKEKLDLELKPIIELFGTIPNERQLTEINRSDLIRGIKLNGGFVSLKNSYGFSSSRKEWNEEKVINELKPIISELKKFPSTSDFKKLHRTSLLSGINSTGGLNHYRELMGFRPIRKSRRKFTDSDIIAELYYVINELGFFPSSKDLEQLDKAYLASRIQSNGGFQRFREMMGYDLRKKTRHNSGHARQLGG